MALIVTDEEDRILRWNLQALRLLNLPENEVSGKNLFDADSVFKETVVRQKLRESRVQRKPSRFAIRYKEPEREVIYVVTASPLRVAGGIISGRLLLIERRVRKPALAT